MSAKYKNAGKFYCIIKLHKEHIIWQASAPRPIISGSGSIIQNIGNYSEHEIRNLVNKHKSYLQDTPHFIRHVEEINSILVATDI